MKILQTVLVLAMFLITILAATSVQAIGQSCEGSESCLSTEECNNSFCVPESRTQDYLCFRTGITYKWDGTQYSSIGTCDVSLCKDNKDVVFGNTKEEVCSSLAPTTPSGLVITEATKVLGEKIGIPGKRIPVVLEIKNTGSQPAGGFFEVAIYEDAFFKEFFKTANVPLFALQQNLGATETPPCVPSEDFVQAFKIDSLQPGESKTFIAYPKAPTESSLVAGTKNFDGTEKDYILFFGIYNQCGQGHISTRATTIRLISEQNLGITANTRLIKLGENCVESICSTTCSQGNECQTISGISSTAVSRDVPTLVLGRFPPSTEEVLAAECKTPSQCIIPVDEKGKKINPDCITIESAASKLKVDAGDLRAARCLNAGGSSLFCGKEAGILTAPAPSFNVCYADQPTIFTPIEDAIDDLAQQIGTSKGVLFLIIGGAVLVLIIVLLFKK